MLEIVFSIISLIKWCLFGISSMICLVKLLRINYLLPFLMVILVGGWINNGTFTTFLLLTLVFLLLCEVSTTFQYYAKLYLFCALVLFTSLIFLPIICFQQSKHVNIRGMQLFWKKTLCYFGVTLEVRNPENLNYDKPCVIICNHQSAIDLITMVNLMPNNTTCLAKKELMYAGPFGLAAYMGGLIFVDRKNHKSAIDTMKWVANIMKNWQVNIWIFPEGTRNLNGQILPFKKGAFHLAIEAQVPIFAVVNSSYKTFLQHENKIFKTGKVIVTCLERFETKNLALSDVENLMNDVRAKMISVFEKTSKEIEQRSN